MGAIIQVIITAEEEVDLEEAICEQMIAASARHWDTSTLTLLRILRWLKASRQDHQGTELGIQEPSALEDLGSESISAGQKFHAL